MGGHAAGGKPRTRKRGEPVCTITDFVETLLGLQGSQRRVVLEFSIVFRDRYFDVTLTGIPTVETLDNYLEALVNHENWQPGSLVLTDEIGLDASSISTQVGRSLAATALRWRKELGPAQIAIFVADDLQFGMNRMWGAFIENQWDGVAGLFRSQEEALTWLMTRRGPSPSS